MSKKTVEFRRKMGQFTGGTDAALAALLPNRVVAGKGTYLQRLEIKEVKNKKTHQYEKVVTWHNRPIHPVRMGGTTTSPMKEAKRHILRASVVR